MTVTCPEGHQSEATDYCDICGTPIAAGAGGSGATGSGSAGGAGSGTPGPVIPSAAEGSVLDLDPAPAPTLTCPHCGAPNVADALFCEDCGYDFTTGAAPLGSAPVVPDEGELESALDLDTDGEDVEDEDWLDAETDAAPAAEREEPADVERDEDELADAERDEDEPADAERDEDEPADIELDEQVDVANPAEPFQPGDETQAEPETDADADANADAAAEPDADVEPQPEPAAPEVPEVTPAPDRQAVAAHVRPRHTPPSRALSDTWVVEVWVDPDWYAVQQTEEACPSPGLPDIVVVRRNVALIGRPSGSLGVRPDVDAGADSAVSRRHAQLTSDGSRWWIEDLGSSNGTYVGSVGEPLPTEPIRQRVEIDRDDRIYVGAWTRLVLRQATASEQAGQG